MSSKARKAILGNHRMDCAVEKMKAFTIMWERFGLDYDDNLIQMALEDVIQSCPIDQDRKLK